MKTIKTAFLASILLTACLTAEEADSVGRRTEALHLAEDADSIEHLDAVDEESPDLNDPVVAQLLAFGETEASVDGMLRTFVIGDEVRFKPCDLVWAMATDRVTCTTIYGGAPCVLPPPNPLFGLLMLEPKPLAPQFHLDYLHLYHTQHFRAGCNVNTVKGTVSAKSTGQDPRLFQIDAQMRHRQTKSVRGQIHFTAAANADRPEQVPAGAFELAIMQQQNSVWKTLRKVASPRFARGASTTPVYMEVSADVPPRALIKLELRTATASGVDEEVLIWDGSLFLPYCVPAEDNENVCIN